MTALPPWANGPFELVVHAEGHLRGGDDFDRRIALISFDNAIEVAITTYLSLHPIQRAGRTYLNADVEKWLANYHAKLGFLETELATRKTAWLVDKAHIIWAHDHRNAQYHSGPKGTPEKNVLKIVRDAALWIFAMLFDVKNVETELETAVAEKRPPTAPSPDRALSVAIDAQYGIIEVGDQSYYVSDLLFAADYAAYRDLGGRLCAARAESTSGTQEEKGS